MSLAETQRKRPPVAKRTGDSSVSYACGMEVDSFIRIERELVDGT